jgi:transcriptional regulator with XRE-family HTH domain
MQVFFLCLVRCEKEEADMKGSNLALRKAREARGWSQAMLAQQIGTDGRTVGRWERGDSVLSPHFRAQLCELFALDAIALGFVQSAGRGESVHPLPSLLSPHSGSIVDP